MTSEAKAEMTTARSQFPFDKTAKANVLLLTVSLLLSIPALLAFAVALIILIRDGVKNEASSITTLLIFGGIVVLVGTAIFLITVVPSKERAVQQCLLVAEKIHLHLDAETQCALISNVYAGDVFIEFVKELKKNSLGFIPAGFFDGSGGENGDSRRNLVEHLWRN